MNNTPIILAIETATSSCSVALCVGGKTSIRSEIGNNVHSKVLLEMIDGLFREYDLRADQLDAVAVGQGPGSFTGLRIGVGVGQGIAYGAGCPMIGVSSLDALALQAGVDGTVIAAIDARMGEVYWCEYQTRGSIVTRIGALRVTPASDIRAHADAAILVGNVWTEYADQFSEVLRTQVTRLEDIVYPSAEALIEIARQKYATKDWVSAAEFKPIYVRDNVAQKAAPS